MKLPRLQTAFETNPNKDFIRSKYDKPWIEHWHHERGMLLKYLGLPAREMLDILEWQHFLGRFTTIEREENEQHLMFLKANVKDVEHRLYSLYGEFDKILLAGRDRYGNTPEWPYDLVNLDYFGGFIYPGLARPKALKKLIQNQGTYESSFLLIVTQHLRDGDSIGEKREFLEDLRRMLKNGIYDNALHPGIDEIIDWYLGANIPDAARQGLYLNCFLRDCGEAEQFDVKCRPAIVYSGTGRSWMIHFTTEFRFKPGIGHRASSVQSLVELINLGLREVGNGKFVEGRFVQPQL